MAKVWERVKTVKQFIVTGWSVAAPTDEEEFEIALATGVHIAEIRPLTVPTIPIWERTNGSDDDSSDSDDYSSSAPETIHSPAHHTETRENNDPQEGSSGTKQSASAGTKELKIPANKDSGE